MHFYVSHGRILHEEMTVKCYRFTKDMISRYITWRNRLDQTRRKDINDKPPHCRRCKQELKENDIIAYRSGKNLGHLYCKECAIIVHVL
jgi:hypothetical protein